MASDFGGPGEDRAVWNARACARTHTHTYFSFRLSGRGGIVWERFPPRLPWSIHRGGVTIPEAGRMLLASLLPKEPPSCLIWGAGSSLWDRIERQAVSSTHEKMTFCCVWCDLSPPVIVFPQLSEVPYWNSSVQPANGPREEGGGSHCLPFTPQTSPSLGRAPAAA